MNNLSIDEFLIAALQNAYRLCLERGVCCHFVSKDSHLQERLDSAFTDPEYIKKQERLTSLVQALRESVKSRNLEEVSATLGTILGEVKLGSIPHHDKV